MRVSEGERVVSAALVKKEDSGDDDENLTDIDEAEEETMSLSM